jgi:hypothetical protein
VQEKSDLPGEPEHPKIVALRVGIPPLLDIIYGWDAYILDQDQESRMEIPG